MPATGVDMIKKLLLSVLLVFMFGCGGDVTEEDRVRAVIDKVAEAAEARDVKAFMKNISKDYRDDFGHDYNGIKSILFYQFMWAEKVSVFVRSTDVEVDGAVAIAETNVVLIMGKVVENLADIIPEDAAGYRFNLVFNKEDGDWKVRSAAWEDVGIMGLL